MLRSRIALFDTCVRGMGFWKRCWRRVVMSLFGGGLLGMLLWHSFFVRRTSALVRPCLRSVLHNQVDAQSAGCMVGSVK